MKHQDQRHAEWCQCPECLEVKWRDIAFMVTIALTFAIVAWYIALRVA